MLRNRWIAALGIGDGGRNQDILAEQVLVISGSALILGYSESSLLTNGIPVS